MNALILALLAWTVGIPALAVAAALAGRWMLERRLALLAPVLAMPVPRIRLRRACEGRRRRARSPVVRAVNEETGTLGRL